MGRPIIYDPATGGYEGDNPEPALFGTFTIETLQGEVVCQPAFELTAELCRRYPPERVEAICGVEREPDRERLPGCSGKRGRSPTMPGAGLRCRRTPPRSPGRLPSFTR